MSTLDDTQLDLQEVISAPTNYGFLNDLDLDQDVVRRLAIHLDGIVRGNSEIYTTPLVKDKSPQSILAGWDRIMKANSHKLVQPLIDIEIAQRSKFGPRSIAKPWKDRKESLLEYFGNHSNEATPFEIIIPNNVGLRPLTADKAVAYLKNNTNSGLPFYVRKNRVKPRIANDLEKLLKRQDPCILFTRTQESDKTRDVWGYPIADTTLETMYYQPLLAYQRKLSWRSAIRGPMEVDKWVTQIIDFSRSNDLVIISIDFSGYDKSVSPKLSNSAFNYIKRLYQSKYHNDLDYIKDRFVSIGIVTPDGVMRGQHGVPSGSTFTNEVDSIVQYLVALSSGCTFDGAFQIQGDDGLYCVKAEDVDKLVKAFEQAGLKVNVQKSFIDKNYCVYLQCFYSNEYRGKDGIIGGIYPTYRALNRLIYQERWSDFEDFGLLGKDYYSIRAISILENVKHHPLFEDFVKYVVSLDKYSLEFNQESISKYANLLANGSGTGGVIYNQYGDDVRGIKAFKSVEIINSIA